MTASAPDIASVKAYLLDLQDRICAMLEHEDGDARFRTDEWTREEGGGGRSRILEGGAVLEKAGVLFSHVNVTRMPASATAHRPELAGARAQARDAAPNSSAWLSSSLAFL